jgi:acetyl esterase/lipase
VASSAEVLYCDSEDLARRLARAGVPCTLQTWERQLHVFQAFGRLLPESRASIADIGAFVRAAVDRNADLPDLAIGEGDCPPSRA